MNALRSSGNCLVILNRLIAIHRAVGVHFNRSILITRCHGPQIHFYRNRVRRVDVRSLIALGFDLLVLALLVAKFLLDYIRLHDDSLVFRL